MANIQLVLWDWNGTLLDDLVFSRNLLNQLLEENGYSQQFDTKGYRKIFGFPIEDYYRRAGFDYSSHPFSNLASRYMQLYQAQSKSCRLNPCAVSTLSTLQQQGKSQVILSASPLPLLLEQTEFYNVQGFFDKLLGLSDIYAKSKVELGLNWMKESGFSPKNAVMIGDTIHDAEVAAAMGTHCILYTGGHQPPSLLKTANCPIISRLSLLPKAISELK